MRSRPRRLVALFVSGLSLVVVAACTTSAPPASGPPKTAPLNASPVPLPSVTLPALRSDATPAELELATLRGPAVLNFWATWCGVCRREMPVLQDFSARHGETVPVLGIDFMDPQRNAAIATADKAGVTYQLLADVEGVLSARSPFPNLRGLPYLALIDDQGRVVHGEFGAITSVAQLEALVSEHLGVQL